MDCDYDKAACCASITMAASDYDGRMRKMQFALRMIPTKYDLLFEGR